MTNFTKLILILITLFLSGLVYMIMDVKASNISVGLEIKQTMTEEEFYESLEVVSSDCGELNCIKL